MKNQAQLITYVDRLSGGGLRDLARLLDGPLRDAFGGVHVLPFFYPIDGADAGFDPIDHTEVDPQLGSWEDVRALASRTEIMADMIVNHISRRSPQFIDFDARGDASPYAGLFLTFARVFPRGATDADLLALHAIRPGLPFTQHQTAHGERVLLWTTFTSGQIDIDVHHPEGRRYLDAILARFEDAGIRAIRIDAAGFAVKKAGTSCFMIPETLAFIADLTARARSRGLEVLVEVHGHYLDQARIARQVDWVYDFVLPPLVLHTLFTRDATSLRRWIDLRPGNSVTVLDTHDGIGVLDAGPDRDGRPGLLMPDRDPCARRGDPPAQRRPERRGHRQRREQSRRRSDQLHVLRRARRQRRRAPRRAGDSVFPAGHPAGLLRRAAGRPQRHDAARPHRRRPRHQPSLLHGGRRAAAARPAHRRADAGAPETAQHASGVRRCLRREPLDA